MQLCISASVCHPDLELESCNLGPRGPVGMGYTPEQWLDGIWLRELCRWLALLAVVQTR